MPEPEYLSKGEGVGSEDFEAELNKLAEHQRKAEEERAQELAEEKQQKLEEGDPSVIASPMPAADKGGAQGNVATGADDTAFGPVQVDPADAGASEESKEANEKLLNVQAAGQDVNQGEGSEEDVQGAKEEAAEAVKSEDVKKDVQKSVPSKAKK